MKKVGILTFHNTTNYGAILQCYALQKYINDTHVECEVINYNNKFLKKNYNINPFKANSIKEFVKKTLYYFSNKKNKEYFEEFTKKNIKVSVEKYDEKNIAQTNNIYDTFIVGSDQVWNYSLSGNDSNYFLDFCIDKRKKNSYAASFGASILIEEYKDEIINHLANQNNISIREDEIIKDIKKELKSKKIIQSIDPVFLLSKNQWQSIVKKNMIIKNKYIFVYEVARTPLLRAFVEKLSNKYNLRVIYLSKSGKKMKNVKKLYSVSPSEFLWYIKNAEYVVTSSFHGMAFSIIFEKNFYFDVQDDKKEFSSRLNSLSRICGIDNRKILYDFDKNDFDIMDYKVIKEKLKREVESSCKYLNNILSKFR